MKLFHKLRKTSAASVGIIGGADGPIASTQAK